MSRTFRTADVPPSARVERWQRAIDEVLVPLRGRHDDGDVDFEASLLTGRMGPVRVSEVVAPAGECGRSAALIRHSDAELYQIDVLCQGEVLVEQAGGQVALTPGDIAFLDPAQPVRYVHSATRHVAVGFPRAMIPFAPTALTRLTPIRVPGDRGVGALVSPMARQLPRHLDERESVEHLRLGVALVDVLAAALSAQLHDDLENGGQDGLLSDVYAFIERHLDRPELTPRRIAAAHHISVRQLHSLFVSQETTVSAWIRRRRLDRCRSDLLDPAQRSKSIHAVAARWGLSNPAHFNRLFKATYGTTPGRFRALVDPT